VRATAAEEGLGRFGNRTRAGVTLKDLAAAAKPPDLTTAARALTPFKLMHLC
jgi:hypothetical protein